MPPSDPVALAAAITEARDDTELRRAKGARGLAYATQCGDEGALYERIIDVVTTRIQR